MSYFASIDFSGLLSIGSYIFLAVGLYTMAKRRGIRNPWLAWIPVANMWLLGCLSDQYQYVALGQQKNKRKMLLTLEIVVQVLICVVLAIIVGWLVRLVTILLPGYTPQRLVELLTELSAMNEQQLEQWLVNLIENSTAAQTYVLDSAGLLLADAVLALVLGGLAIWLAVVQYMAYSDILRSADPRTAGMFLALGIVLSLFGYGILLSIFVFINREKDQGMPPRQDEMTPPPPVWTPPTPPTEPWA